MPGHYLEFDLSNQSQKIICFQTIADYPYEAILADSIKKAIEQQQVANVPVGVFFSGGTDSSIMANYNENNDFFLCQV